MNIINVYQVTTPASLACTNDADVIRGNQSALWGGCNFNMMDGTTGNATAGDGLANITTTSNYNDQVISKVILVKFDGTLKKQISSALSNYLRLDLDLANITGNKVVIGVLPLGVYDAAALESNNTPTASLIVTDLMYLSVVKDCLIIEIPYGTEVLFQGKILNVLLMYIAK